MPDPVIVQSTGWVLKTGQGTPSLPTLNGVQAGNSIIVRIAYADSGNNSSGPSAVSDGAAYMPDISQVQGHGSSSCWSRQGVAAGNYTIQATKAAAATAANVSWLMRADEVANLVPGGAAFDAAASAGNTAVTTSPTVTTNALTVAPSLVLAVAESQGAVTGYATPSGWNNDGLSNNTFPSGAVASLVVENTSAVTAAFGTISGTGGFSAIAAVYKGVPTMVGAAAATANANAALTTAIRAAAAASGGVSAVGALTNWATVTLTAPLYTGPGGILDPNFWQSTTPGVGTVVFYDSTNITIYADGEISSINNNCSAVVQFFDGSAWQVGVVIITPQMVSYTTIVSAAAASLSTAVTLAAAALSTTSLTGNLSSGIQLASNALAIANAAAALLTGIQMNAAALAGTAATGALTGGQASLQGNAAALSNGLALLTTKIQIAAQVAANSVVAGALSTQVVLEGAANALAQVHSQLNTAIILSANMQVVSSAAGTALITSAFSSVANALSSAMGSILTAILVAGNALVSSSAAGQLTTGVLLEGAAQVDTAAAFSPPGLAAQYGFAKINVLSPTGLPVAQATFIAGSSVIITIEYFNAQGLPFIPNAVTYRVNDVNSGASLVPETSVRPDLTNVITVLGTQNQMINLTRSFEDHEVLFKIVDGAGNINFVRTTYELLSATGLN